VAHAFARIEPDFREGETGQESTTSWCLARLMTRGDRNVVVGYVNRLLEFLFAHGFEHGLEVFDTTVARLIRGMETTSAGW
jgi:hypothetical protein